MVDVALKILLHDKLRFVITAAVMAPASSLRGGRSSRQSRHHLGRGLARQVGGIEVGVETNGSIATPVPGFVLQLDRRVFRGQIGQPPGPVLLESSARGGRAISINLIID